MSTTHKTETKPTATPDSFGVNNRVTGVVSRCILPFDRLSI